MKRKKKRQTVNCANEIIVVALCTFSASISTLPAQANDFKQVQQQLIADRGEKPKAGSDVANVAGADDGSGGGEATENKEPTTAGSNERSALSGGDEREPHTLLYYVINAIATIIGITLVLAIISSSTVTFCACIWHILKLKNGGKKPSIG